jgi:hypothetical protein
MGIFESKRKILGMELTCKIEAIDKKMTQFKVRVHSYERVPSSPKPLPICKYFGGI